MREGRQPETNQQHCRVPMSPSEIQQVLREQGLAPRHALGQNFLADQGAVRRMVEHVRGVLGSEASTAEIVEVGPGLGALTAGLLSFCGKVYAVELDRGLAAFARATFSGMEEKFALLEGDAVKMPLAGRESAGTPVQAVVSNLPFAITSPWLDALLDCGGRCPEHLFLVLQKDAADRLGATSGSRLAGALTIRLGAVYRRLSQWRVAGGSFFPVPGVDSVFSHWQRRGDALFLRPQTVSFLRVAFQNRRKVMRKAMAAHLPKEVAHNWAVWLLDQGYPAQVRAEALDAAAWEYLDSLFY